MLVPQDGEGDLLAAVDGDGIAVVDQIAGELLVPDQMVHQLDVGLLDLAHIDAAQQPEQGIGMGEVFQLRKQYTQVFLEHGPGDFPIGRTPGRILEHKDQDPVDHQDGDLIFELVGVSRVGDLAQALE